MSPSSILFLKLCAGSRTAPKPLATKHPANSANRVKGVLLLPHLYRRGPSLRCCLVLERCRRHRKIRTIPTRNIAAPEPPGTGLSSALITPRICACGSCLHQPCAHPARVITIETALIFCRQAPLPAILAVALDP